jgi:hypothetical protein
VTTDAGSTNTYIVIVDWVVAWANTPDWSVSLTDLEVVAAGSTSYFISKYQNLGELPITETR